MIDEEIRKLVEGLMVCYNEAYDIYEPQVRMIIDKKIKDSNFIERTLDGVMDIYTEKGFNLFMKLLLYYQGINPYNAQEYFELLSKIREEEYHAYVKKLKK